MHQLFENQIQEKSRSIFERLSLKKNWWSWKFHSILAIFMFARREKYQSLNEDENNCSFDITVESFNPNINNAKGKFLIYFGSRKNKLFHVVECDAGKSPKKNFVSFSYVDPKKSAIVVSLYNKASRWSEEKYIGETEILISDFETVKSNLRELQFSNNGPRVLINAHRVEGTAFNC